MIKLDSVEKRYDLGEIEVHALGGVSLTIERGEYVAIMGPSGSGKSTLLNILGILDTPSGGAVSARGLRHYPGIGERTGPNKESALRICVSEFQPVRRIECDRKRDAPHEFRRCVIYQEKEQGGGTARLDRAWRTAQPPSDHDEWW